MSFYVPCFWACHALRSRTPAGRSHSWSSAILSGEHDQAVAIGHISHWSRVTLSTPGPGGLEQEQRRVFEVPTNFAPMCTKLLNQAAIVIIHLSHAPSC